ncbi:hypothetical protein GW17_00017544 [Ensete ventricosum]|nr:hypothetical protein GW17_00017544 [Ensete ventricosum]
MDASGPGSDGSCYYSLGIHRNASASDIRSAYRCLALVTGTRTAHYWTVPPKFDRRRLIEEEIDRRQSIEREMDGLRTDNLTDRYVPSVSDGTSRITNLDMQYILHIKVCNFDMYRPVRVVHIDPSGYQYADRPFFAQPIVDGLFLLQSVVDGRILAESPSNGRSAYR